MKILQANTLIGIFISSLTFTTSVGATEIIHYQNKPVTIELHAGEERSIQFGDHVQVGITKGQQTMKLFRVQSAQGAVHFLPYREFEKQRVQIKRVSDGRIILVDLMATTPIGENTTPLEDVRLLLEEENEVPEDIKKEEKAKKQKAAVISPVDLTRYAAQRLYGPTRLHNDKPGILETSLGVSGEVKIFKGENKFKTVSMPILAYQGGGYYLAAIHIRNVSEQDVHLNYLDLNLPFSHATFQHHALRPVGIPGDSTVLYLVSERPLKETLFPWDYFQPVPQPKEPEVENYKMKESGR